MLFSIRTSSRISSGTVDTSNSPYLVGPPALASTYDQNTTSPLRCLNIRSESQPFLTGSATITIALFGNLSPLSWTLVSSPCLLTKLMMPSSSLYCRIRDLTYSFHAPFTVSLPCPFIFACIPIVIPSLRPSFEPALSPLPPPPPLLARPSHCTIRFPAASFSFLSICRLRAFFALVCPSSVATLLVSYIWIVSHFEVSRVVRRTTRLSLRSSSEDTTMRAPISVCGQ